MLPFPDSEPFDRVPQGHFHSRGLFQLGVDCVLNFQPPASNSLPTEDDEMQCLPVSKSGVRHAHTYKGTHTLLPLDDPSDLPYLPPSFRTMFCEKRSSF